jgi:hypothetical protein
MHTIIHFKILLSTYYQVRKFEKKKQVKLTQSLRNKNRKYFRKIN